MSKGSGGSVNDRKFTVDIDKAGYIGGFTAQRNMRPTMNLRMNTVTGKLEQMFHDDCSSFHEWRPVPEVTPE